jgi:hypothetical protein
VKIKILLYSTVLMFVLLVTSAFGAPLSGSISVNQTSDTAAKAKSEATNIARKQILFNVLSQYTDKTALNGLLQDTSNDDLMNLIVSSTVANEHISATAYSANITMIIDNDAVKRWLSANNIQNWVPAAESAEKFTALIVISNGIADWADLKRITRDANVEIETQSITGNQIVVKMPLNYRTKFTAAVREAGWKYSDNEGILHIWK